MAYAWLAGALVAILVVRLIARWIVGRMLGQPRDGRYVVLAGLVGVLASYLAMVAIIVLCLGVVGTRIDPAWYGVASIVAGGGAEGKLVAGDRIVALDHEQIRIEPGETLVERLERNEGDPIVVTYMRGGVNADVSIQPTRAAPGSPWKLGVKTDAQFDYDRGLLDALPRAFAFPYTLVASAGGTVYARIANDPDAQPPGATQLFVDLRGAFAGGGPGPSTVPVVGILFLLIVVYDIARGIVLVMRSRR